MDRAAIDAALEETFDWGMLRHGYADHLRDYEAVVVVPGAGGEKETRRYVFRHCVEAHVETALTDTSWRLSLDDSLLDPRAESDGYVWGVRWQNLYPGHTLVEDSERARQWSERIGIPFHEVRIESNVQVLTLVFSDLAVVVET